MAERKQWKPVHFLNNVFGHRSARDQAGRYLRIRRTSISAAYLKDAWTRSERLIRHEGILTPLAKDFREQATQAHGVGGRRRTAIAQDHGEGLQMSGDNSHRRKKHQKQAARLQGFPPPKSCCRAAFKINTSPTDSRRSPASTDEVQGGEVGPCSTISSVPMVAAVTPRPSMGSKRLTKTPATSQAGFLVAEIG